MLLFELLLILLLKANEYAKSHKERKKQYVLMPVTHRHTRPF